MKDRLNKLTKIKYKWAPEVLHLLLELSNKPVSNSRLEDLDFLKPPEPEPEPPLQWKDLVSDDPLLREKRVWKNVDFGADSSDDEEDSHSDLSELTETTNVSSADDEYVVPPGQYTVHTLDKDGLDQLRKAQFWRKTPNANGVKLESIKKLITELDAIREVLFMLSGLPTSLFDMNCGESGLILSSNGYTMRHASHDAFQKLTRDFAAQGSSIMALRLWSSGPQSVPLLQILQSCIAARVKSFEAQLSQMEQRFVARDINITISLLSVQADISSYLRPLTSLSEITKRLDSEPYAHAFRCLEMLFDQTCISQMGGDDEMYVFMGTIFFECFQVYLRPLRLWMEEGVLRKDDKVFFVSETNEDIELASLWHSRFRLRKNTGGLLHAPKFLQPSAAKIFITGKSVVMLKHLNSLATLQSSRVSIEPVLEFHTVCDPSLLQFAPFSELFNVALEDWVRSKHRHTSSILRATLFDSCGLQVSLDALAHLFFLADGITGANFTNAIFDKLDTLDPSWKSRYTLTELAQGTLGSLPFVSPDRLRTSILSLPRKYHEVSNCRRSVKTLAIIQLKYHLSWPIQTILTPSTLPLYQRIFTLLVQVRRSSHILSRQRLVKLSTIPDSDERALYCCLRTRLLWFSQTLYYYLTALVIDPNTRTMRAKLKDAEDVDTMIRVHETYIKTTLNEALLGTKLQLIHKTILKILDQAIKLEDLQAADIAAAKEAEDNQQEMMDTSMASLGLTPRKGKAPRFQQPSQQVEDSDDDEADDIDFSILSSAYDSGGELYIDKLRSMKLEFDRLVRFVASGLRGVARAADGEESRSWDVLGEMLEAGIGVENSGWR